MKTTTIEETGIPATEFGSKLTKAMNDGGLGIDDIREITQTTYETARRIVRGLTSPNMASAKLLANHFKWDLKEIQSMLVRDRERVKHGELLDLSHGKDPAVSKIVRAFAILTDAQKKVILEQAGRFIEQNKA